MSLCVVLLVCFILLSGLDDLFIGLVFLATRRKSFPWPDNASIETAPERAIAIFVPLWHESSVIGRMIEGNLAVLRYHNYHIFAGAYPNDPATCRAVGDIAGLDRRVHLATTGCDGPTSKGDCLNWIYRRMENYEAAHGMHFEIIVIHDAEDMMHPDSLRWINWFSAQYAMVQIPVLPIPTGFGEFTHGLYCDEFAEYQSKDIPVRQWLGGFLPSNGVGCGFSRAALQQVAQERGGLIFDPHLLTEDYETGYLLHSLGLRQIFVPLRFDPDGLVATREYFPRSFYAALKQRSRWVAGIALQGWERHGWRAPWRQIYWLWRDRKGLIGNLLSPAANAYLAYGIARYAGGYTPAGLPVWLGGLTIATSAYHLAARTLFTARIYGWRLAAGAPLRIFWSNTLNFLATGRAIVQFSAARIRQRHLAWAKTEHVILSAAKALHGRPRLGEVLVNMRRLSREEVTQALHTAPPGMRLGEHLVGLQRITEDDLYQALSFHAALPLGAPKAQDVSRKAIRALPVSIARRWGVLPYRVAVGALHVLTATIPCEEMTRDLSLASGLDIRFRLVRPSELERLCRRYLPEVDG